VSTRIIVVSLSGFLSFFELESGYLGVCFLQFLNYIFSNAIVVLFVREKWLSASSCFNIIIIIIIIVIIIIVIII
jgi:hypothetical protein